MTSEVLRRTASSLEAARRVASCRDSWPEWMRRYRVCVYRTLDTGTVAADDRITRRRAAPRLPRTREAREA